MKNGHASFLDGFIDKHGSAAYGLYNDTITTTGWGVLDVKAGHSKVNVSNHDMMYAAGVLEGVLTAE